MDCTLLTWGLLASTPGPAGWAPGPLSSSLSSHFLERLIPLEYFWILWMNSLMNLRLQGTFSGQASRTPHWRQVCTKFLGGDTQPLTVYSQWQEFTEVPFLLWDRCTWYRDARRVSAPVLSLGSTHSGSAATLPRREGRAPSAASDRAACLYEQSFAGYHAACSELAFRRMQRAQHRALGIRRVVISSV